MPTGIKHLIPLVQGASGRVVHDVKFFLETQKAFFGDRVVRWCSVQDFPTDTIANSLVYQFPNMLFNYLII